MSSKVIIIYTHLIWVELVLISAKLMLKWFHCPAWLNHRYCVRQKRANVNIWCLTHPSDMTKLNRLNPSSFLQDTWLSRCNQSWYQENEPWKLQGIDVVLSDSSTFRSESPPVLKLLYGLFATSSKTTHLYEHVCTRPLTSRLTTCWFAPCMKICACIMICKLFSKSREAAAVGAPLKKRLGSNNMSWSLATLAIVAFHVDMWKHLRFLDITIVQNAEHGSISKTNTSSWTSSSIPTFFGTNLLEMMRK